MSDTPRTDKNAFAIYREASSGELTGAIRVVRYHVSEQLEIELAEARAEIERKDKLIEQMRDAISDVLRHAEPPQHDIRGCMWANCCWCYAIRARDAALSAAERINK